MSSPENKAADWQRVKAILASALDLPPEERQAYVEDACADAPGIRADVQSLLGAEEDAADFIEAPAFPDFDELAPGLDRVGPYTLIRPLGRGGMGSVFLARRSDGEIELEVAVKLIRRGMDTDEILSRFRYERQILADLDHPSIARLLDAGTAEDERPYFVMEHVEGQSLLRFSKQQELSTSDRLRLFIQICMAVHYAHQNLIVHRDLKPANILVTPEGTPKLLDFGIAKLLGTEDDASLTRTTGARIFTPEYASPEQLRGTRVTTASDVYSLGVVLYELLTGQRPYELDTPVPEEILRRMDRQTPTRPSLAVKRATTHGDGGDPAAADPEKLRKRLRGDLDHIVLKAIRQEPEARYGSAEQLAADLGRHLDGLPVEARTGTWSYQLGKLLRRQWRLLLPVALVAMLAIAALFAMFEQRRVEKQAAAVQEVLKGLLESTAESSNDGALEVLESLLETAERTLANELADTPFVDKAELLDALGRSFRQLGLYGKALPLLTEALKIRRSVHGQTHPDVATSLMNLGVAEIGLKDYKHAEQHLEEALTIYQGLESKDIDVLELAKFMSNFAGAVKATGNFQKAVFWHRRALELKRAYIPARGGEEAIQKSIAKSLGNLANSLYPSGNLEEAEVLFREALSLWQELGHGSSIPTARVLNNHSLMKMDQGQLDEAEAMLRRSLEIRYQTKATSPGDAHIETGLRNLAQCRLLQGELTEARELIAEAQRIIDDKTDAKIDRVASAIALDQGRFADAEEHASRAHEQFVTELGDDHWQAADAASLLGAARAAQGDVASAERLLESNLQNLLRTRGEQARVTREAKQRWEAYKAKRSRLGKPLESPES